nr:DUF2752 domain-containing protein [uncultured Porphyromonas sp.]
MRRRPALRLSPYLTRLRRWARDYWLIGLGLLLLIYALVDPALGYFPSCLIYRSTGLRCPGCGTQRALHALLGGRLGEALHYNYFLLIMLPLGLLYLALPCYGERWPRLARLLRHPVTLLVLGLLTLGWVVLRNYYGL